MPNPFSYGFLALPAVLIPLCLAGALIALRWRRPGIALALAASLALSLCATSALSTYALRGVESEIADAGEFAGAQAIIVLGAGVRGGDGAQSPDALDPISLERIVFAARAYRRLHLPVAVSGGPVPEARVPAADLMKAALEQDFAIPVRWDDNRSLTTWENALYIKRLLDADQISTVILVTHAWHMPRALWSFERVGLHAIAWPSPRTKWRADRLDDFLPSIGGLQDGFLTLHELIGEAYYKMRH